MNRKLPATNATVQLLTLYTDLSAIMHCGVTDGQTDDIMMPMTSLQLLVGTARHLVTITAITAQLLDGDKQKREIIYHDATIKISR